VGCRVVGGTTHIFGKSNGTPGHNGASSEPQNNDKTHFVVSQQFAMPKRPL
jgi:hypothetical protein